MIAPPQIIPVAYFNTDSVGGITYTSGGSGDLGGTSTNIHLIAVATNKLRFLYSNYSPSEALTSAVTIQASIQETADSGTPVQITFNGATSVVINPGQSVWSDWYYPTATLPAGRSIGMRTFTQVASGGTFPQGQIFNTGANGNPCSGAGGLNYVQYGSTHNNGSNQILTAGSSNTWIATGNIYNFGPSAIVGYAADGVSRAVGAIVGDSIALGVGDDNTIGGYITRALYAMGITYYKVAQNGEALSAVVTGNNYTSRFNKVQRATFIVFEYGTNDFFLVNTTTFATVRTRALNFLQYIVQNNQPVFGCTLLPRPTYTPAIFPVSNQTVNVNNANYQLYNAWMRAPASAGVGNSFAADLANLGITCAGIIDAASYIETDSNNTTPGGPSAPNTGGLYWCGTNNATSPSSDGTHPNYTAVQLIQPALLPFKAAMLATAPTSVANVIGTSKAQLAVGSFINGFLVAAGPFTSGPNQGLYELVSPNGSIYYDSPRNINTLAK